VNPAWPWIILGIALLAGAIAHRQTHARPRRRRATGAWLRAGWLGPLTVFIASLALGSWKQYSAPPLPPLVHDEFSYLLAADTFLHGRLTNPTPPGWQSFETFHELMRPTYMSKYPPGQGLLMAGGRSLGLPHNGTYFVMALACAAVCWMTGAWLPPTWAIVGGLLAAWAPIDISWGSTYWGGGGAMLGGALLGGAVLRLMRPRLAQRPILLGATAALGLALLANTRPFEGLLFTTLLAAALAVATIRLPPLMRPFLRTAAVASPLMICLLAWMAYYNWRITGNPLEMPYMEHTRQYVMAPLFRFQSPRPAPHYQSDRIRELHAVREFGEYQREQTWPGFVSATRSKLAEMRDSWLAPLPILIPLLAAIAICIITPLGRSQRSWRPRHSVKILALPLVIVLLFPLIHQTLTHFLREQYLAPAAAFFYLSVASGTYAIAKLARRHGPWAASIGAAFAPALLTTQLIAAIVAGMPDHRAYLAQEREAIIRQISTQPGNHIVFVAYPPHYGVADELVWNDADIPKEKVIMARWIDAQQAANLMQLYPNRTPWHLVVTSDPTQGTVYHVGPGI
jgi:hypothetical protein